MSEDAREERAILSPWDGVSVIVGIVVGVSLFRAPGPIFASVDAAWQGMAIWGLGGALSLIGALCYAELASTYPRSGGLYGFGRLILLLGKTTE